MPPLLPTIWLSGVDASDPERGVHCEPLTDAGALRKAWTAMRLLSKLLKYLPKAPPP